MEEHLQSALESIEVLNQLDQMKGHKKLNPVACIKWLANHLLWGLWQLDHQSTALEDYNILKHKVSLASWKVVGVGLLAPLLH